MKNVYLYIKDNSKLKYSLKCNIISIIMVCLREGVTYAIKVTILLTVAMDLFVNSYRLAQENQKEQNYCLTEACIETANSLFKVRKINTCYSNDGH